MKNLFIAIFVFLCYKISGQEEKPQKVDLNGYISNMQSMMSMPIMGDEWISNNYFHNRLNFFWYPNEHITASVQLRNRFFYGDYVKMDTTHAFENSLSDDIGFMDLAQNLNPENHLPKSFILNSMIDRLWIQYTIGNLEVKIGRQRINWGQTYAWNPNDIFNTYSFFDFDYIERPGSDAIRVQYYTGMASSLEAAIKLDSANNVTAASLVRLNKWNYDMQFLGGVLNSSDYVIGGGFSGNIKNVAVRGEMSYFHPIENIEDTSGIFYISAGADYSCGNSLYLQFEALYSHIPTSIKSNIMEFFSGTQDVKKLSFSEFSVMGQVSYPISPLVTGGVAVMGFFDTEDYNGKKLNGFYLGPNLAYSISQNFNLAANYQLFQGNFPNMLTGELEKQQFHFAFLRLKWSF
ncbi:MAG: hypothetical protein JXB49_01640 [Bacteroidales bacterium]|nr:hypothetical protein [Bacteroidales bacterium]